MTATTFATSSIKQTEQAIYDIQEQIARLTEQLTQKQGQLQMELGLEQTGLSAISQFKEAVTRIAEANNPVMLQNFLQQMHQITQEAIFSQHQDSQPKLAEAPEPTETEPTEPKPPTAPEPTNKAEEDDFVRNHLAFATAWRSRIAPRICTKSELEAKSIETELTDIAATSTAIDVADSFPAIEEQTDPITAVSRLTLMG